MTNLLTTRARGAAALAATLLILVVAGPAGSASEQRRAGSAWPRIAYPSRERVEQAEAYASTRAGIVSFAVLDRVGGVRGLDPDTQFSSASVSKALILAAELRRLRDEDEELDDSTRSVLESMIAYSDNDAAGAIYARVGDTGMAAAAERAGMRSFEVTPGYWGGAQVTAGDLARFFAGLDRNLAGPYHDFGKGLFAGITSTQRWGIPAAVGGSWGVYFKGGWRPLETEETSGPVTHQAALLEHRDGTRIAIAVLSDQPPGGESYETIEGITRRLLAVPPSPVPSRWTWG
jgi:CubicO group peptidase (beta-lactamase class C family)